MQVVLNLALLCLKQADYSEGQLFATRAREIDPDNIKARFGEIVGWGVFNCVSDTDWRWH